MKKISSKNNFFCRQTDDGRLYIFTECLKIYVQRRFEKYDSKNVKNKQEIFSISRQIQFKCDTASNF